MWNVGGGWLGCLTDSDILGTTDQITVTDNGDGTLTVSIPDPLVLPGNLRLGDSDKIELGDSQDYDIYFSGARGEFDSAAVGTNFTGFLKCGAQGSGNNFYTVEASGAWTPGVSGTEGAISLRSSTFLSGGNNCSEFVGFSLEPSALSYTGIASTVIGLKVKPIMLTGSVTSFYGLYIDPTISTCDGTIGIYVANLTDGSAYNYAIYTSLGLIHFGDTIDIATDKKITFRDAAIGIYSQADSYIDIFADGAIRIGDSSAGAPTNYLDIQPDGEIQLVGTARVVKEAKVNIVSLAPGASGASQTSIGRYPGWAFALNDDMLAEFEIPFDWDSSTDLELKVYWAIDEAYATNSGEVQWEIQWSATPSDASEALDSPTHTGTIDFGDQNIPATAKYLTKTPGGSIAAGSLATGDLIGLAVKRVVLDGGSNPTAEPVAVHLEVEYTSNKLGEAT